MARPIIVKSPDSWYDHEESTFTAMIELSSLGEEMINGALFALQEISSDETLSISLDQFNKINEELREKIWRIVEENARYRYKL